MESIENLINHLRKFTNYEATWTEIIRELKNRERKIAQKYGDYCYDCAKEEKKSLVFSEWLEETYSA